MWWQEQKRILLDHPYFDCRPGAVLSRTGAELIYKSGFPTFGEMIQSAKMRFGLSADEWAPFDEVIASRTVPPRHEKDANFFTAHKRLSVAMMIVILVLAFFSLVPFGRALAADFFNMIMRIVDGRIEISSENPDYDKYEYFNLVAEQFNEGDTEYIEENAPVFYPSIDEFVRETGYAPVTMNAEWLRCQKIQSYSDDMQGLTLTIQYATSEGALVVATQRWGDADIVFEVEDARYEKALILGDTELYYAIDPSDGSFNGTAVLSDSLLFVGAEKKVDMEKLLETLE